MNRGSLAAVGALALLAAVLLLTARSPGPASRADTAEQAVANLLYDGLAKAMREGNVRAYLNCFADPLRSQLATVARADRAKFAAELRAYSERVTGIAVSRVEVVGDDASARLEWVYRQEADVQQVRLTRSGGRWRIVSLTAVQRSAMPVPYGTEVIPGLTDPPK